MHGILKKVKMPGGRPDLYEVFNWIWFAYFIVRITVFSDSVFQLKGGLSLVNV